MLCWIRLLPCFAPVQSQNSQSPGQLLKKTFFLGLILCGALLSAGPSSAQGAEFEPGDVVEIKLGPKTWRAKVVGVSGSFFELEYPRGEVGPRRMSARHLTLVSKVGKPLPSQGSSTPGKAKTPNGDAPKEDSKSPLNEGEPEAKLSHLRTWKDSTGNSKIKARLKDFAKGEVILVKEDNSEIKVPLEKLSRLDQQVVKSLLANAGRDLDDPEPGVVKPNSVEVYVHNRWQRGTIYKCQGTRFFVNYTGSKWEPYWVTSSEVRGVGGEKLDVEKLVAEGVIEQIGPALTISEADRSTMEVRKMDQEFTPEPVVPDAARPLPFKLSTQPISLSANHPSEKTDKIFLSRAKSRLILERGYSPSLAAPPVTFLEWIDLQSGKELGKFPLLSDMEVLDVSRDGLNVLCRCGMGRFQYTKQLLVVWKVGKDGLQLVKAWRPYGMHSDASKPLSDTSSHVDWAFFHDQDRVFTGGNGNEMVLWNISEAKAIYSLMLDERLAQPGLSVNGKYLAVPCKKGIGIVEPLTGKLLSLWPDDSVRGSNACFSPDGERLVSNFGGRFEIWNVRTGEKIQEITLSIPTTHGRDVQWIDQKTFLYGQHYLIDLERQVCLWEYQCSAIKVIDGIAFCGAIRQPNQPSQLTLLKLPHPEALKVAETIRTEDLYLAGPGTRVNIVVSVDASEQEKQDLQKRFTEQLEANGMIVAPNADFTLSLSTVPGAAEEVTYRDALNFNAPTTTVMVPSTVCRIDMTQNGASVWSATRTVSNVRGALAVKEGQTLEQAAQEKIGHYLHFFNLTKIPKYIRKPREIESFGASVITTEGLKETKQAGAK